MENETIWSSDIFDDASFLDIAIFIPEGASRPDDGLLSELAKLDIQFTSEVFGRSFAHDIANPLTAININIDFLKKVLTDLDTKTEVVNETLDSSKRLIQDIHSKINTIRYYTIPDLETVYDTLPSLQIMKLNHKGRLLSPGKFDGKLPLIYLYLIFVIIRLEVSPLVSKADILLENSKTPNLRICVEFIDEINLVTLLESQAHKIYDLANFNFLQYELNKIEKISSKYNLLHSVFQENNCLLMTLN